MTDESHLISRAQQGDAAALAAIVENHQRTVYNVALRMCGNAHDAEETLQETFLSAIKALPKFEGRSQLSTWLYRIASNTCLMQRRRAANAPDSTPLDNGDDDEFEEPRYFVDWSYQPDDVLLDKELREVMEKAIVALPDTQRLVFIWRELEGLSTAETAEVLGISEGTVKVRLHRARMKLRELLSAGYLDNAMEVEADGRP
jgi:RNA polymerase sigma-70 factor (ECF subfamily)